MRRIGKNALMFVVSAAVCLAAIVRADDDTNSAPVAAAPNSTVQAEDTGADTNAPSGSVTIHSRRGDRDRGPRVEIGHSAELSAGETTETMVVVRGSANVHGHVKEAVVAVLGDIDLDDGAEVGEDVVAIMGNIRVAKGAVVHGDVVAVGGRLEVAEGAKIEGERQEVDLAGIGLPRPEWLRSWLEQCVFKARPLALQLPWLWSVAGMMFLIYLLIVVAFPRPVQACVSELTWRPATTFLMGLLTMFLCPLVLLLLTITGIGVLVVPFVIAAVILGALVGKAALLQALGTRVSRMFGSETIHPAVALTLGTAIVYVFYTFWVIGLLALAVTSVWGLGIGVTAAFGGFRRELPEKPRPASPPGPLAPVIPGPAFAPTNAPAPGPTTANFAAGAVPFAEAATLAGAAQPPAQQSPPPQEPSSAFEPPLSAQASPSAPLSAPPTAPPVVPDVLLYPKATFWERMAAAFLDMVLVVILGAIVHGPPLGLLVALAYFSGMWAWKGTTIGGIVLGLKVARADGKPITFVVALVRGLAAAFSALVLFLGFLWIVWDADKQGWHDRIAGTVVLRLPKGTPLVMF